MENSNKVIKFRAWFNNKMVYQSPKNIFVFPFEEGKGEIMQFTGLLDKNGKEIYSGDILFNEIKNGVVQWSNKYVGWMSSDIHKMDGSGVYKVIGNIYQNPELIK